MTRKQKALGVAAVLVILTGTLATPRVRSLWGDAVAGSAYVAKSVCSGVLMAGMDLDLLMSQELIMGQGLVETTIDESAGEVQVDALFGLISARAKRQPGLGCSLYHDGDPPVAITTVSRPVSTDPVATDQPWPLSPSAPDQAPLNVDMDALTAALDDAFSEPDPDDPRRTRAVVVVQDGWVIAERYAPGIEPTTPLIGWSMNKSVTHALVGIAVADGLLELREPIPVPEWSSAGDPRAEITLDQLLRMSSGLDFGEVYDDLTSDVVVMLTQAEDAGALAADKPLISAPDEVWYYSSGTTNIVSRALRRVIGDDEVYWRFPYDRLFTPLGMRSAVLETDPSGTFVGSSYGYASARDWARFGLLYLNDGIWDGKRILPEGWVEYGVTPTAGAPRQEYGAHWWLNAGGRFDGVPTDEFRASGFDGQFVMVIPSRNTVIVRLGQTPGNGFDSAAFERAILAALPVSVQPEP